MRSRSGFLGCGVSSETVALAPAGRSALRQQSVVGGLILRPCPVLAIAREFFPAKVFSDSIPCGIGHRSNNNQRKVFVWQKVEMAEAKVAAAVKAEAVEDKETAVVGLAARPASRPGAADQMLRPAVNRTVGFDS